MKNNVLSLTVALVVGVILVGSLVAPIITAMTDETKTYTNEGMPFASVDEDTHTIVVTSDSITVDGETIDLTLFPSGFGQYSIAYAENGFIRYNTVDVLVGVADTSISGYGYASYTLVSETVTITIVGDVATVTTTDADKSSVSISDVMYYISSEGDYVMTKNPCVASESVMYGAGETWISTSTGVPLGFYEYLVWSGDVEEVIGNVVAYSNRSVYSLAYSDSEVNYTEVEDGLYQIDSVILTTTATHLSTTTDYDVTATYTYFLAPASVTYDNPEYVGSALAPLMLAIIVVVLLALVMMAARNVTRD